MSDTLVSILRDDPRWAALPADTPPNIRQLLRRCLQKDPRKRLPHIGAARIELTEGASEAPTEGVPQGGGRHWVTIAALGALAGGIMVAAVIFAARPAAPVEPRDVVQFTVDPDPSSRFTGANGAARFAISPDGRQLVYQTQDSTGAQLFIRALNSSVVQPVPGTAVAIGGGDAQQAFWSPDGRFLAFFDESAGQLKKLDRTNGLVQVIASVPGNQLGGSWSDDGTIVFASMATLGVRRVAADGGTVTQVTNIDPAKGESAHLWPDFLPDGIHFVFQTATSGSARAIYLGSLDGGAPVRLFESETAAVVARPDQLLFGHDGALMSQAFDLKTLAIVGTPRIVADRVPATAAGRLGVSASRNGVLAFGTGDVAAGAADLETHWLDRAGGRMPDAPPSVGVGSGIRLSPDGRSLIYHRYPSGIWIQDTVRGIETRLTTAAAAVARAGSGGMLPPVFSPEGSRVLYRQDVAGAGALMIQPASGTTAPVEVIKGQVGEFIIPFDWAQDGRILFSRSARTSQRKFAFLQGESNRQPVDYLEVLGGAGASLSPDGRWLAYAAGVTGQSQVFVQSFPDPSVAKVAASGPGGTFPRWNPQGGELFFVDNARLMAVPVKTTPRLEVGAPVVLFEMNSGGQANPVAFANHFDVMPDGRRFVALRPTATGATNDRSQSIVVTVNWQSAVR